VEDGRNASSSPSPDAGDDQLGASQFTLLTLLGLHEDHTLLDIGCGSLSAGRRFLSYLAPGSYFAIGPNTRLLDEHLTREIGQDQIALRSPTFSRDADCTLTTFGQTFDFLLAEGFFSRASQREIARCLAQARLVMKPESVFAATFTPSHPEIRQKEHASGVASTSPDAISYTLEQVTALAAEHGLCCRQIGWPRPDGQVWVLVTRPWRQGTIPTTVDSPPPGQAPVTLQAGPGAAPPSVPEPAPPPRATDSGTADAPHPSLVSDAARDDRRPHVESDESHAMLEKPPTTTARPFVVVAPSASVVTATIAPDLRVLVDGVGVRYWVPTNPTRSLKEYVIRRLKGQAGEQGFWALNGVSLTVRRGEVVGIVGRNGAGKSTLLKTISRVLRPTVGRVVVRGQVTPLLELGAGFHQELTGRENTYLNATLLGHSRREVDAALERIVDFAELHAFFDAPVRTYSTGMVGRLGFAIATAWDPDILILDEILGAGDSAFQKKCARRIAEMRAHASTVLLVSHSMESIRRMCQRVIWIDHGMVKADGPTRTVISQYRGD
jgi:ABC-type polysaccharide/polyol phosphate transport system ATPase subunit